MPETPVLAHRPEGRPRQPGRRSPSAWPTAGYEEPATFVLEHGYCRSLYVRDPNGLLIELTADHPDVESINATRAADGARGPRHVAGRRPHQQQHVPLSAPMPPARPAPGRAPAHPDHGHRQLAAAGAGWSTTTCSSTRACRAPAPPTCGASPPERARRGPRRGDAAGRSTTRRSPGSTSSPTARSAARATSTTSPTRSTASTRSGSAKGVNRVGGRSTRAVGQRADPPRRTDRARRRPVPARRHRAGTKVTVPGPFTLSQLAQNEYYPDQRSLALAYAEAINAELRRPRRRRHRRRPARRAVHAGQRRGGARLRRRGDQPRRRRHRRDDRAAHLLRLRGLRQRQVRRLPVPRRAGRVRRRPDRRRVRPAAPRPRRARPAGRQDDRARRARPVDGRRRAGGA